MTITFSNSDIARMYSTSTGDSDIFLTEAVEGCKTFSQAGIADSQEINYGIVTYGSNHRPVGMEVGTGTCNYDSDGNTILHRTTVISSILSSDSAEDVNLSLTGLSQVYIPYLSKDVLTVQEADGNPLVYPVNKIKVTNGTLTDNGDGSVSITTGGGGGGGSLKYGYLQFNIGDSCDDGLDTYLTFDSDMVEVDANNIFSISSDSTHQLNIDLSGVYEISYFLQWNLETGTPTFDSDGYFLVHIDNSGDAANISNQIFTKSSALNWSGATFEIFMHQTANFTDTDVMAFHVENYTGKPIDFYIYDILFKKLDG